MRQALGWGALVTCLSRYLAAEQVDAISMAGVLLPVAVTQGHFYGMSGLQARCWTWVAISWCGQKVQLALAPPNSPFPGMFCFDIFDPYFDCAACREARGKAHVQNDQLQAGR